MNFSPSNPAAANGKDDEEITRQNEFVDDMMAMATAYRQAQDEDIMNANNILSMARSQTDVQDLVVYVVSMAWFRKAYDLLTFHSHSANATLPYPNVTTSSYREVIGPITNVDVLVEPKSSFFTHPSLPHNINGQQPQQQKQQPLPFLAELEKQQHQYHSHQQQEQYHYHSTATAAAAAVVVAPDQKHAIDYILVGSNVWLLLGHKFGYDVAVPIHCVYCPTRRPESNNSAQNETGNFADDDDDDDWMKQPAATSPSLSCLSFPVTTTETVHMPTSGRFPYEQYLQTPPPPPPIIPQPDPVVPAAAVVTAGSEQVVSDEEDEPMSHSFRNDDDSDTGDDLFPSLNENTSSSRLMITSSRSTSKALSNNTTTRDVALTTTRATSDDPILRLSADSSSSQMMNFENDDDNQNDSYWNDNSTNNNNNISSEKTNGDFDDEDNDGTVMTTIILRRRFGSGLGNLGNTCFMNSTLQCLAHTQPLQRYFLTGAYVADLNRDNPLGTGGELATQFAQLLAEMWGSKQVVVRKRNQHGGGGNNDGSTVDPVNLWSTSTATNIVYPKNFKYTLGKHAEQFMGYDQHDSQELATYLLDALHEDCNRVTKKPYIEKPEQADEETDQEASDKAWDLHLKREDSRVLENFMGQVKSRVQCCQRECGRVSTTFDPFMFLSVPIPGSDDRTLQITYVPLDPNIRLKKLSVKVSKMASIEEMLNRIIELLPKEGCLTDPSVLPVTEDLEICDIWKKEVFDWIKFTEEVEKIRENDDTVVYQLRPLADVRKIEEQNAAADGSSDAAILESLGIRDLKHSKYYHLDVATLARINRGEEWTNELRHYLKSPLNFVNAFHARKGSSDDRVRIYRKLVAFIDHCHRAAQGKDDANDDTSGQKRTRANDDTIVEDMTMESSGKMTHFATAAVSNEPMTEIIDQCYAYNLFVNVSSQYDVAVLEFLAGKMLKEILNMERQKKDVFPNGVKIELRMRKHGLIATAPLVLRIPSSMTVFELREEIAFRLSRSLKAVAHPGVRSTAAASTFTWNDAEDPALRCTIEDDDQRDPVQVTSGDDDQQQTEQQHTMSMTGSPESWIVRRVPLSYERKSGAGNGARSFAMNSKQLGSIARLGSHNFEAGGCPMSFAQSSHDEEKALVAELVGNLGQVFMDWPADLFDEAFDSKEYEAVDVPVQAETAARNSITVLDCIEKFCQMEQLEESEQWYCSRCKAHVCAWKQFHIYRSPPHLIVHLKRFQFSARTHRRQKIGVFIDFPLKGLDLTNQVLHWTDDEKPIYDCYAVSNHYGGLGGGHYTAYALNDGGVWCHYDDSRITSHVDPSEVVSQAAYVLYYRRRDVPVGLDFEMTLPTPDLVVSRPVMIQDPSVVVATKSSSQSREPSEISSSAAMIDDDEVMMDHTGDGSRSTSPASVDVVPDEYNYPDDEFSLNGGDDDQTSSMPGNNHDSSLPLQ